jgi:glycine cleavage system regulatory protein
MGSFIVTLVGPDRPGLVSTLAGQVACHGGSWLESRMARLAGQFAGIVRIELPDEAAVATIRFALDGLREEGFGVLLQEAATPPTTVAGDLHATLSLIGQDRPGIVRDLTRILAAHRVNIEELTTNVESASFSGEEMFRAAARLRIPAPLGLAQIRTALEGLGNEFMVDVQAGAAAESQAA